MPDSTVTLAMDGGVARVTLARPDVRNAFNADVIRELHAIFTRLSGDAAVRAVVLAGEGKVFAAAPTSTGCARRSSSVSIRTSPMRNG